MKIQEECSTCAHKYEDAYSPECYKCKYVENKLDEFPLSEDNWESFFKLHHWYKGEFKGSNKIYTAYILVTKAPYFGVGFNWHEGWTDEFHLNPKETKNQIWMPATVKDRQIIYRLLQSEAAKRFPVKTKFLNANGIEQTVEDANHCVTLGEISCGYSPKEEWSNKVDGGMSNPIIWKNGIWAKITQPVHLTLNDTPVTIVRKNLNYVVNTEKGAIKDTNWYEMHQTIRILLDLKLNNSTTKFDVQGLKEVYTVIVRYDGHISIGCIDNISLLQLEQITYKLRKNESI